MLFIDVIACLWKPGIKTLSLKFCHKPGRGQMLKSHKILLFLVLFIVIAAAVWNLLNTGTQTFIISLCYIHFLNT